MIADRNALVFAENVLATTESHPDAPSAIPAYFRALLMIAAAREKRDLEADDEFREGA